MIKRYVFLPVIALSCAILLSGMGDAGPRRAPTDAEVTKLKVERVLRGLESSYETLRTESVMESVHQSYSGRLRFQSDLTYAVEQAAVIDLLIVLDSVVPGTNGIAAKLHWFKHVDARDGTETKTEGSSEFIFKKTAAGLKLIAIHRDNPFF